MLDTQLDARALYMKYMVLYLQKCSSSCWQECWILGFQTPKKFCNQIPCNHFWPPCAAPSLMLHLLTLHISALFELRRQLFEKKLNHLHWTCDKQLSTMLKKTLKKIPKSWHQEMVCRCLYLVCMLRYTLTMLTGWCVSSLDVDCKATEVQRTCFLEVPLRVEQKSVPNDVENTLAHGWKFTSEHKWYHS